MAGREAGGGAVPERTLEFKQMEDDILVGKKWRWLTSRRVYWRAGVGRQPRGGCDGPVTKEVGQSEGTHVLENTGKSSRTQLQFSPLLELEEKGICNL